VVARRWRSFNLSPSTVNVVSIEVVAMKRISVSFTYSSVTYLACGEMWLNYVHKH
jgi:hypothetical protein